MIHMIIADDDRLIRESLTQLIDWGSLGIEIIASTETGTKTLEQVFLLHPDILLTDIEMPGINGIDLLQEIKKHDSHCEVIFLSAYSYFSYAQDAVRYGAVSYTHLDVYKRQVLIQPGNCHRGMLFIIYCFVLRNRFIHILFCGIPPLSLIHI